MIVYSNIPSQVGAYKLYVPNLVQINSIWGPLKDFANSSTSWSFDPINSVQISLDNNFSRRKWQFILICLVLSWNTGLEAMWRADYHNASSSTKCYKSLILVRTMW